MYFVYFYWYDIEYNHELSYFKKKKMITLRVVFDIAL